MARVRLTFRQRDITAAIKAVERAGHIVARIEIEQDGKIVIIPAIPGNESEAREMNPWDEVYENQA
jgi:hypothetical protein